MNSKIQGNKEKINLPLNPNSKSANLKKLDYILKENATKQKSDEIKHNREKINGDPELVNHQNILNIHSNRRFKEMKKEFINLWENRENRLIFNKIRDIKSINSLLTLKTKTLHGQHKKKVEGLYYELFEKENNNVIGTMKNMNLMMKPSFNKYKLNPVSENRLKSTSNLIELKKESRNFLTSQGYNNKANIGNIM